MSREPSSSLAPGHRRPLRRPLLAALSAVTLLALGAAVPLAATTLLPMDLDSLADQAELVFTGTAMHNEIALTKDGAFPFTFTTFRIHDVLKGRTRAGEIVLRFAGGDLGDRGVGIVGMPEFKEGETYLLFVRGNGRESCPILGWEQGMYRFSRDTVEGKSVLVDFRGAPLHGIRDGRWVRGPAADVERARPIVLSQEDVTVTPLDGGPELEPAPAEDKALAAATPAADELIVRLRSFLGGRRQTKSYTPGRWVESARPADVPDHFGVLTTGRR